MVKQYELVMDGATLGTRHRYLNSQVNKVIEEKPAFETVISESGNCDVDHLFKIDVSNKYGNVEYILDVLKSDDMLYVSRAIKNMSWLITDDQYSHIINPEYLHTELFPHMQTKAICKLLLHIRLHLKDEKRVDEFYKHQASVDIKKALKWLPYCSLAVIKQSLDEHNFSITPELFKKLCERYTQIFEIILTKDDNQYLSKQFLETATFILYKDTDLYLDILEKFNNWYWPKFGKRITAFLMKNARERIVNKFHKYNSQINLEVFAKYIPREEAKHYILTLSKNKKLVDWFNYNNIKPLIKRMPKEGKFEFLKIVFIEKSNEESDSKNELCAYSLRDPLKSENTYQWYRHAPFAIAFPDLKKLIKLESSAEERSAILKVIVTTAVHDMKNIKKVLQYYHDKHINEVFKFKISFINTIISDTKTHRYDEHTWKVLDELFHSAEVYIESDKKVQSCVDAIVVYKLLHKQAIPEIIEKKFKYNTLKYMKNTFDQNEKDEVFKFLYNYVENKMDKQVLNDQSDANRMVSHICDVLDLLLDWDKELMNYPNVVNKIKYLAMFKHEKDLDVHLESIYNKKKSWKKNLFDVSLLLSRRETVYMNVLKHDPTLFERYAKEVDATQCDDKVVLWKVMYKLTVYWQNSLANEWADAYRRHLNLHQSKGHKALVRGLCGILPREELLGLLNKYAPDTAKIAWSEIDETLLNLRKNFGELMYKSRGQLPLEAVVCFAVGDYTQFVIPTLNSMLYNVTSNKAREYVPQLLKRESILLQKYAIRVACSKLKPDEVNNLFSDLWNTTKNTSMRFEIFKLTYSLLCLEKNEGKLKELWRLLEIFIENLTSEENPMVYKLLGSADKIPEVVRAQFCMKSLTFLKSLPAKFNVQKLVEDTIDSTAYVMESMDPEFVTNMLLELYDTWLVKSKIALVSGILSNLISNFIFCAKNQTDQKLRYDNVVKPLLDVILLNWHVLDEDHDEVYKDYCNSFLRHLLRETIDKFPKKKFLSPLPVLIEIKNRIEYELPIDLNYYTITLCNLILSYVKCYEKIGDKLEIPTEPEPRQEKQHRYQCMWKAIIPLYAEEVVQMLRKDIEKLYPSILYIFTEPLSEVINILVNETEATDFERELLKDESDSLACLLAVHLLPDNYYNVERNRRLNELRALILKNPNVEVRMHCLKILKKPVRVDEDCDVSCGDDDAMSEDFEE